MTDEQIKEVPLAPPDSDVRLYIADIPNPDDPNDPCNQFVIQGRDNETLVTINLKTGDFEFADWAEPKEAAVEFFRWLSRFIKNYRGDDSIDPPADGCEAEQLRQLFEEYTSEGEITGDDLQEIMDRVDARDSLQVVTTIARLREKVTALQARIKELEG